MIEYTFAFFLKQFLQFRKNESKYNDAIFENLNKIEINPDKSKHLKTVTTKIFEFEIDLMNLRKETYVEDSWNPVMKFETFEENVLHKNFTINSLFYNIQTAEVEDFTDSGLKHLNFKIIKTFFDSYQIFQDDFLWILRNIRFASKLAFQIDAADEKTMMDSFMKLAFHFKINRKKVGIEMTKMLRNAINRVKPRTCWC